MQDNYDLNPFGSNMLFGNNIALKEYYDSLPHHVQYEVTTHVPEFDSIEEIRNYAEELMKQP